MKKILCLCDAGEVRSVAMAKVLRERGHFAVAGSFDNIRSMFYEHTGNEVFNPKKKRAMDMQENDIEYMGFTRAFFDKVIFMQEGGEHFIGRDDWGNIDHPELVAKCRELVDNLELEEEEDD